MIVYLIRHGQTEATERHLYCGSTDLPLSPSGREALLCRGRLDIQNVQFISSGLRRADETLRLLFGPVPCRVEPRFREVDFGCFEMHSYEQLRDRPDYQAWLSGDNQRNVPPGGESGAQMTARALEALSQLREDSCIVTHGGVIAAIMAQLFPAEGKNRYQWQPAPGGGYCLYLTAHTRRYEILT